MRAAHLYTTIVRTNVPAHRAADARRERGREEILTDYGDNVSLCSKLVRVSLSNVVHTPVTHGLSIGRVSNLVPHVSRVHDEDDELDSRSVFELSNSATSLLTMVPDDQMYVLVRIDLTRGQAVIPKTIAPPIVAPVTTSFVLSTGRENLSGIPAISAMKAAKGSALYPLSHAQGQLRGARVARYLGLTLARDHTALLRPWS